MVAAGPTGHLRDAIHVEDLRVTLLSPPPTHLLQAWEALPSEGQHPEVRVGAEQSCTPQGPGGYPPHEGGRPLEEGDVLPHQHNLGE